MEKMDYSRFVQKAEVESMCKEIIGKEMCANFKTDLSNDDFLSRMSCFMNWMGVLSL
jgi:hypothetical protein